MVNTEVQQQPPTEPAPRGGGGPDFRRPFESLRREMNRLFEDFEGFPWRRAMPGAFGLESFWQRGFSAPAVDIVEKEKEYLVTAELPGLTEKDIEIKVTDQALVISGEKQSEHETKEADYQLSERRYGSFQRRFSLPAGADADRIDARFANGVLTITLPKRPDAIRPERKIEIRSE